MRRPIEFLPLTSFKPARNRSTTTGFNQAARGRKLEAPDYVCPAPTGFSSTEPDLAIGRDLNSGLDGQSNLASRRRRQTPSAPKGLPSLCPPSDEMLPLSGSIGQGPHSRSPAAAAVVITAQF